MSIRVGINGFGRIGRLMLRIISEKCPDIDVVAINDLVPPEDLAYLLKYDSVHHTFPHCVTADDKHINVNKKKILALSEREPEKLPWKDLKVDYVIESTGYFTDLESANKHRKAGAKRVIISAPAKGEVPTFVMGVNQENYNPQKDFIVSNASCTTNCLAPLTKILLDHFGIEEGLMTTVHAMTATQHTVDSPSRKDRRGGRAASINIIPSSTGAAKAVALCLPEVKGKLTGMALRVPVIDVSVVDLTVRLTKATSYEEICAVIQKEARGPMKGIVTYCDEDVVSSDFIGHPSSCIFDRHAGIKLNSHFYKLIAWYDNEMGYSHRVVDLLRYMVSKETLS
ncbi:Glyceraldehyde-3-phosphate dehydrogenase [Candidatus Rhabdochlamydia oedothoracis]|uniref:Glyceraldehyde-3-phosphate dehydrogenase n=2 Tax=cellular organisms TaxID=131567 RepID=A0ABX8UZB6_9BACT|nr:MULTISPECIES: type I glyceraldehyde-3-phosphate dehydrogenase [Rhabdochlamydia]KAG6559517.1 Glyceraldehyde-3-phosphate dehydrogenase 1 [Candidatus Rhabdochlamydia sp. W815]QYF48313.1 Glyceraldehyde-3-phosphate dehydrogenase [Candidatus Rhabdochlamydia oedothoracis]